MNGPHPPTVMEGSEKHAILGDAANGIKGFFLSRGFKNDILYISYINKGGQR
jgi:hypothetical protein